MGWQKQVQLLAKRAFVSVLVGTKYDLFSELEEETQIATVAKVILSLYLSLSLSLSLKFVIHLSLIGKGDSGENEGSRDSIYIQQR